MKLINKNQMAVKNWLLISFFTVLIFSCKEPDPVPENKYLKESTFVNEFSKTELISDVLNSQGFGSFVQSGLKLYKITYKTTSTSGDPILASGAFIIPIDFKNTMALASIQHGTIFDDNQAPSYFASNSEAQLGMILASQGYFIAMPDYVGYGESKNLPHPYEHRKGLAVPNVDFLFACKEFIRNEKLNWNQNLLLAGYSEGGYATLATQKLIEENYSSDFKLVASSCGAGAYNKTETVKSFFKTKTSGETNHNRSYLWVLLTYNRIYGFTRPLSNYFSEKYVQSINTQGHLVTINVPFDEILNPEFSKGLLEGKETQWLEALKDNDIFDWKVKTPTRLYHGNADTYVPHLNSVTAEAAMKARGSADVKLFTVTNGTHGSSVTTFLLGTLDMFNTYKDK
jgi:pimeloyl-ACP methyl ester carboxylesterase